MRPATRAEMRPPTRDVARNPITCVLVTAAVTATFWLGVIWLVQRLHY